MKLKHKRLPEYGEKVRVYRNLRNGLLSIMDKKGHVIGHAGQVVLVVSDFIVRQSGRERVLRENRKNVHAYVVGKFVQSFNEAMPNFTGTPIKYNPYKYDSFVNAENELPVKRARWTTIFKQGLILAIGVEYGEKEIRSDN